MLPGLQKAGFDSFQGRYSRGVARDTKNECKEPLTADLTVRCKLGMPFRKQSHIGDIAVFGLCVKYYTSFSKNKIRVWCSHKGL